MGRMWPFPTAQGGNEGLTQVCLSDGAMGWDQNEKPFIYLNAFKHVHIHMYAYTDTFM